MRLPDGRRINLRCSGRGAPIVILESGFGADSHAWAKVQRLVARRTKVCSYDRAGYGDSDPGPLPRHGEAIARDLDQALRAARLRGPFVLVGHSAGGLYVQLFAGRRRADVAGLVLVDTSIVFQDQRMEALFGKRYSGIQPVLARVEGCRQAAEAGTTAVTDVAFARCVPATASATARAEAARPSLWRTQVSELETLFTETSKQRARLGGLIAGVPTTVLTASRTGEPAGDDAPGDQAWETAHRQLAAEFKQGTQRLVRSGHLMIIERPDEVVGAILERVEAARGVRPGASHDRVGIAGLR